MSHRLAPMVAFALAAGLVAACIAAAPGAPSQPSNPSRAPMDATSPSAEPTPGPSASPGRRSTNPSPSPEAGNVNDLPLGPVLSIQSISSRTIQADLDDIDAKAWRIVVAGTGDRADDRLELTVETGDVAPAITLVQIEAGRVVDRADLSGYGDPTATAGRCHASLGVCVDADGIVLPVDGDGHLGVELTRIDDLSLTVTGETAGWPGEPFILGSWTETDAFPWDPGVTF